MPVILNDGLLREMPAKNITDHTSPLLKVDPARCKPWKYHNRDAAWLIKERCLDLIASIQKNGQIDPVIVRRIKEDPNYDFEIICGVRRWYSCTQIPNQFVLVCTTDADDKACMVLMHSENADSKDISEFERAFSFAQQIKSGVFKNQTEMAEAIGVSQGTVSKMIKAAEIFEHDWIRVLFNHKLDISVKHAYALSVLLKKAEDYPSIKEEARIIRKEMEKTRRYLPASKILKRLIAQGKSSPKAWDESIILTMGNKPIVSCRRDKFGKLCMIIERNAKKLNFNEIEKVCIQAIREYVLA